MKKYRTYTAKKYKVWKKVLFFAIVAVIIFGVTVIVGNNLKNKLENSDIDETEPFVTTAPEKDKDKEDKEESVPHDEAFSAVSAGYMDLSGITEQKDANAVVEKLKTEGYNAVSFLVTDSEGMITYSSKAVETESRLPSSKELIPFEILSGAVARARNLGMSAVAVMEASESISDPLLVGEMNEMGFDSVILRGYEEYTQIDNNAVDEIKAYVEKLRKGTRGDMAVSICFGADFYRSPKNAPYLEKIYNVCEFLSIDMTNVTAEEATAVAKDLSGSFYAFRLRPLLSGSKGSVEVNEALSGASVSARQYISAFEKPETDETKPERD